MTEPDKFVKGKDKLGLVLMMYGETGCQRYGGLIIQWSTMAVTKLPYIIASSEEQVCKAT